MDIALEGNKWTMSESCSTLPHSASESTHETRCYMLHSVCWYASIQYTAHPRSPLTSLSPQLTASQSLLSRFCAFTLSVGPRMQKKKWRSLPLLLQQLLHRSIHSPYYPLIKRKPYAFRSFSFVLSSRLTCLTSVSSANCVAAQFALVCVSRRPPSQTRTPFGALFFEAYGPRVFELLDCFRMYE